MSKRVLKICLIVCLLYGAAISYGRYNGAQARKLRQEQNEMLVSKTYSNSNVWRHDGRKPVIVAYPKVNKPQPTETKSNNWLLASIKNTVFLSITKLKQIPWKDYTEQTIAFIQNNIKNKNSKELISINLASKKPNVYYKKTKQDKSNLPVVVPIEYVPIQYVPVQQNTVTYSHGNGDVGYCPPVPRGNFQYKTVSYRH
jgi:hypothetical protein